MRLHLGLPIVQTFFQVHYYLCMWHYLIEAVNMEEFGIIVIILMVFFGALLALAIVIYGLAGAVLQFTWALEFKFVGVVVSFAACFITRSRHIMYKPDIRIKADPTSTESVGRSPKTKTPKISRNTMREYLKGIIAESSPNRKDVMSKR